MSWGEDLAALAGIRERLACPELLAPEEVALLATQAEALVRPARSLLRRSEGADDGVGAGAAVRRAPGERPAGG